MQPPFDIAADLDTPVSAFLKLAPLGPCFLLESVTGGENVGRYSFIGIGIHRRVRLTDTTWEVDGSAAPMPAGRDAFLSAMRAAIADCPRLLPEVPDLPFSGGLVGLTGYDVVRRFEPVPTRQPVDESLPQGLWVAPRSLLVFDHATRRAALLHAGSEDERLALRRDVLVALRGPVPRGQLARYRGGGFGSPTVSLGQDAFCDGVRHAKRHIVEGDVFQLVLSSRFSGQCELDPFEVYRALRLLNPSPYMYFFDVDGLAVVGSSPEALVRLHGRQASLRPIAGTRARGTSASDDLRLEVELLADPKESAEHVMLVDLARNDLGRVAAPGSVRVDPYRTIERYSHVMHIVSGVTGELLAGYDALDLFAATFPAGTVVGAPKVKAMAIIEALEPVRRGPYAGTVGTFGVDGQMDQAIAIRTLWFSAGQYHYQAGAGVVADSDPLAEYREVLAKSGALRRALALAEDGL